MLNALVEAVAVVLIVAVNGVLAGAEIAVVSSREGLLERRSEAGDRGAAAALRLLRSPNRFLSTIQVGITAVGVAGGVFGGARIAATLSALLVASGVAADLANSLALGIVFVGITGLVLVFGELVPKRVALLYPEELAARLARPMERLSRLASPLVRLLSRLTAAAVRALRLRPPSRGEDMEGEIQALVARAARAGVLEAAEEEIVDQLFRLSDQTVGRIMTPRERIVWLDAGGDARQWTDRMGPVLHTRYLVCRGSLDRLDGYVKVQDLFRRCAAGEALELGPLLREPHRVSPSLPALRLMELFQWSGDHLAVVVDDAERILGLVTFHDVVEGIVGEIPEEYEVEPPRVVRRADGSVLADGLLPLRDLLEELGVPADGVDEAQTVHAALAARLGAGAETGARATVHGTDLEIVDMDGRRIDQVLVRKSRP